MKIINWSPEKNQLLKETRDIGFEEVVEAIIEGRLLGVEENSNYPHQKNFIIDINNYCYVVPFVREDTGIFLKTIIPSRKKTKEYLKEVNNNEKV
ncbi:MAG: hypothetical protein ACRC40_01170 [Fusobacteriaceae bacterium]